MGKSQSTGKGIPWAVIFYVQKHSYEEEAEFWSSFWNTDL